MFKIKSIILSAALLLTGLASYSQVSETVNLTAAGTLKTYSFTNPAATITNLTVTGRMDARDIQFMRDSMDVLAVLDMGGVTIDAYTGTAGTAYGINYSYLANEMPSESFTKTLEFPNVSKTSLVSVVFPSNLNSIGGSAFFRCYGLTSIHLPSGLTSIGDGAFSQCNALAAITNLNPVPITIDPEVFYGVNKSTCVLTVSSASLASYQSAPVWQDFSTITGNGITVSVISNLPLLSSISGLDNRFYTLNESVTVTATPFLANATFENWTSNGVVLSTVNPFTFTVTSDTIIVANFVADTFTVFVSVNNAAYGSVSGGGVYNANDKATLTAIANPGYAFDYWLCGGSMVIGSPYTFTVTSDTSVVAYFKTGIGISETTTQSGIVLYPNPVKDAISITMQDNTSQVTFMLYDIQGRQLVQQDIHTENTVSVAHLSSGMYIYTILTEEKRITGKIVKE
jgi:hypothetical protein